MKRSELELELTKILAIRQIGWEIENCIAKAKTWAPKVIATWPDLFPDEKVPMADPALTKVSDQYMKHHPASKLVDPGVPAKPSRSVARRP